MPRLRDPRWFLVIAFLALIAGIPAVQLVLEIRQDDGIRALEVFSQSPTAANLRAFERRLESANWAARTTRPWLQYAQFQWLGDGGSKAILGEAGWYFYKPGLSYMASRPEHPTPGAGSATNDPLAAILHFRDQLAAHGIRLILMPAPNKESIYPDRLGLRDGPTQPVLAPRTRDLLNRVRAANIEVIDLFQTFAQSRQPAGPTNASSLYLAQDTHWSPAGVALAAKAAARRLQELRWLTPGNLQYRENPIPIQRLGDIIRMLQVPAIDRSIRPEPITCLQVVSASDGKPYKDSADAEILVLGDSFMRIYQEDEPGAAGFIAHLAKELRQPVLGLVNDGGGSTLVRRELRTRPAFLKGKKVLLWEFVERDIGLGVEGWKWVPLPPPAEPHGSPAQGSTG